MIASKMAFGVTCRMSDTGRGGEATCESDDDDGDGEADADADAAKVSLVGSVCAPFALDAATVPAATDSMLVVRSSVVVSSVFDEYATPDLKLIASRLLCTEPQQVRPSAWPDSLALMLLPPM